MTTAAIDFSEGAENLVHVLGMVEGVERVEVESPEPGVLDIRVGGEYDGPEVASTIYAHLPAGVSTRVISKFQTAYVVGTPPYSSVYWTCLGAEPEATSDPHAGQVYNEYTGEWVWL